VKERKKDMVENKYFEDYVVGEIARTEDFVISEEDVANYLDLVGDDHAVHRDKEFCLKQFGSHDLVVPGCLILAIADSYWANMVTPSFPFSPHYGHDKIRYIGRLTCGEIIYCEFKLIEKCAKNTIYGMLSFETYVKKKNGEPIIYEIDKVLVLYRNTKHTKYEQE